MKRPLKITLLLSALFMLSGCSLNAGVDTLLTPPKLSTQQEHIYKALTDYAGTNISLKYPKSGDYLSAFIIADVDGDSENEAVVFYRKNSLNNTDDSSLRMNILDQNGSGWHSVCDYEAGGNEIEQVKITKLGNNDRINIIVGYSLINQSEKVVSIYDYSDGKLNTTFENNYYSVFDTADINGDGTLELFTALGQSTSRQASAAVYYLGEDGNYLRSTVKLSESFTGYSNMKYGKLPDGSTAVYLDADTGNGMIATEVFTVDSRNNLIELFAPDIKKEETLRPSAYTCGDVDGDGETEIPVPVACPGYEGKTDDSRVYFSKWYVLNDEDKLEEKYLSYQSITDGYTFIIPDEWRNKVTVDVDSSGLRFCRYDKQTGTGSEIFRVVTVSDSSKHQAFKKSGFELLHSKGDKMFFIKINAEDELVSSPAEIMLKFKFEDK